MRLLHIEDQPDFRVEIVRRLASKIEVISYVGVNAQGTPLDLNLHANASNPIEEQIAKQIKNLEKEHGEIDAVLLDTDLSAYKNGISQSSIRSTCCLLGLPVLRYSKRPQNSASEKLQYLATIAREGSQSILLPGSILKSNELADWLIGVVKSFEKCRKAINKNTKDKNILSPAQLLAKLLKLESIESELLGYSGANFFFFGDLMGNVRKGKEFQRNYSTQFGYWLANYVLLFPGPILNEGAAAAYLETHKDNLIKPSVIELLEKAVYKGPFNNLGRFYVRSALDAILLKAGVRSFNDLLEAKRIPIKPLDYDSEGLPSYYCLINDCPVSTKNSIGPLDWIPRGALICRIRKDTYGKFGPWLNV